MRVGKIVSNLIGNKMFDLISLPRGEGGGKYRWKLKIKSSIWQIIFSKYYLPGERDSLTKKNNDEKR